MLYIIDKNNLNLFRISTGNNMYLNHLRSIENDAYLKMENHKWSSQIFRAE